MEENGEVPILVGENQVLFSYGGAEFGFHTHDAHPTITLQLMTLLLPMTSKMRQ